MQNGDLHLREMVKTAREDLAPPTQPMVPAGAELERSLRILANEEIDGTVELMDECIREPITDGLLQTAAARSTRISKALPSTRPLGTRRSARIAIKSKGRILFIDAADVVAVEAKGNYVLLLHNSSSHMLRGSISTIEDQLNLYGFVRIHRSVLVNAAFVEEIHPWSTGEYVLRVRGGREFRVTRTYKRNLQSLAQLWIGMDGFAAG